MDGQVQVANVMSSLALMGGPYMYTVCSSIDNEDSPAFPILVDGRKEETDSHFRHNLNMIVLRLSQAVVLVT